MSSNSVKRPKTTGGQGEKRSKTARDGRPTTREGQKPQLGNMRSVRSTINPSGRVPPKSARNTSGGRSGDTFKSPPPSARSPSGGSVLDSSRSKGDRKSKYQSDGKKSSRKVSPPGDGKAKPVLLSNTKKSKSFIAKMGLNKVVGFEVTGVAEQAVQLLNLSVKDIKKLKRKFDKYDDDGSGAIEIAEFFDMLSEERTPFTDALFSLIDEDNSGTISFNEFVQVLTTYCIYSQTDILFFIFSYFDKDNSGSLDEKEFVDMCAEINAKPHFPGSLMKAFTTFDCNEDGLIDFDEFVELNKRYPLLLFPAFRLQDQMQRATLGERRWTTALEYKAKKEAVEQYKLANNNEIPPWGYRTSWCGLRKVPY